MPITLTCERCKKIFTAPPSRSDKRFCSRNCYQEYVKEFPQHNANWRGGLVEYVCDFCGNIFYDLPSRNRRFCSRDCNGAMLKGIKRPILSQCAKERWDKMPPKQRQSVISRLKQYADKKRVSRESFVCSNCGKTFTRYIPPNMRMLDRYCSVACVVESNHGSGPDNPNWKDGASFIPYTSEFTLALKIYIRTRDQVCQLCSKTPAENGEELCVHHIDYIKDNCNERNLIALCRSCHCTVNGRREFWKQHFQSLSESRFK